MYVHKVINPTLTSEIIFNFVFKDKKRTHS